MHRLHLCIGLVVLPIQVLSNPSYFVINQPTKGTEWVNGQTNFATWTTGVGQGISVFDVELARLSADGLIYVARNVPISTFSLPVVLQDVPAANDYFLLFLNSTHGAMYAMSPRFSILPPSQSSNSSTESPVAKGQQLSATVTISGAPNPTSSFAYTFAPTSDAIMKWMPNAMVCTLMGGLISMWTMY